MGDPAVYRRPDADAATPARRRWRARLRREPGAGQDRPVAGRRARRRGRRHRRACIRSGRRCGAATSPTIGISVGARGAGAGRRHGADAGDVRLRRSLDGRAAHRAHRLRRQRARRSRSIASSASRSRAATAATRCATGATSMPSRWRASIPIRRRSPPRARRGEAVGMAARRGALARRRRARGARVRWRRSAAGARLLPEPRRRRQRAGRADRLLLRRPRRRRRRRSPCSTAATASTTSAASCQRAACATTPTLFNGLGLHVLVVDSLTPRYEKELCTQRIGKRRVTQANRRLDALGAIAYLAERRDVDAKRIGLIGWSNGGSTVLAATNLHHPDVAARDRQAGLRDRLLSRLRGRPEARLRAGGAAADAGRPGSTTGRRRRRAARSPARRRAEAGDRDLSRRLARLRSATSPVRLRKDVPNGVNPGRASTSAATPRRWRASRDRVVQLPRRALTGRAGRRGLRRRGPEHGEPALRVGPVARRREARVAEQGGEALERVLARVLGVDALAGGEAARAARPGHGQRLARLEVHLDARLRRRRRSATWRHWRGSKSLPIRRLRWRSTLRLKAAVTPSASS